MKKTFSLLFILMIVILTSCKDEYSKLPDGLYAELETSKGTILLSLNYAKAPVTVANFVTLSEGKNTFVSKEFKGKPFFDGLKFHRVIEKFMIQTGDPLGNGSGDAGYKFKDEITDLRHDKSGVLSMANSGPNTNSSQFFITHLETPWLDGKHTVFGEVIENGMDVVNTINQDDYIKTVKIIRKGESAKKFDPIKVFSDYFKDEATNQKKQLESEAESKKIYHAKYKSVIDKKVASFAEIKKTATKSTTGLQYKITQKGSGKKPAKGATVFVHYAGFLEDGTLFDTSSEKIASEFGKFNSQRAMQNGYSPLPFEVGSKDGMIPGFIEGLEKMSIGDKAILYIPSNLAYGEQGAGNVIPPSANIIFEIELLEKMPTKQ